MMSVYRMRIALCAPLVLVVVLVSMVPALQFAGWQWVVAFVTLPVVTWGAWPFHRAALVNLRHGATTMDTLVSLGVTASTLWSVWALIWGGAGEIGMTMDMSWRSLLSGWGEAGHHGGGAGHAAIYFEGAAMITLFLLVGRYIEHRTKGVARDALTSLLHMSAPTSTLVIDRDGERVERLVPTAEVQVGDMVRVRPGERIPVDGVVVEGASAVDSSVVSGESVPVDVTVGSEVVGGTLNTWGTVVLRASAVGDAMVMARIGQMVVQAQAGKAEVQRLADRVSAVFVPVVLALAGVTFLGWMLLNGSVENALTAAVAVLVVACPCALGLATPMALMVGSAQAARRGVVIRSPQALERVRRLSVVVFDKTGTITDGQMSVVAARVDVSQAGEAAQWVAAASVEALSEHPIARAIVGQAKADNRLPQPVEAFTNHAGSGVSAVIGDDVVLVGKPSWLLELGADVPAELADFRDVYEASGATVVGMARVVGGRRWLCVADEDAAEETGGDDAVSAEVEASGAVVEPALAAVQVAISGMTCASCVGRVERKLRKMGGVSASVNLATESALISRERDWSPEELIATIEAAGYQAQFVGWKEPADVVLPDVKADGGARLRVSRELLEGASVGVCAFFAVKDAVKDGAAGAVAELKEMGISPVLLTGDNDRVAGVVAAAVGIDRVFSQVTPEGKCDFIVDLRARGEVVAMVGDGVNDAAALASADLGMAMDSGTDVAQDVADIILTSARVDVVPAAVRMSQATLRVIKQNLGWAFAYNVVLLPLAVAGVLNPMVAAVAMSLSSVCVVVNSLRLRRL